MRGAPFRGGFKVSAGGLHFSEIGRLTSLLHYLLEYYMSTVSTYFYISTFVKVSVSYFVYFCFVLFCFVLYFYHNVVVVVAVAVVVVFY